MLQLRKDTSGYYENRENTDQFINFLKQVPFKIKLVSISVFSNQGSLGEGIN